MSATVVCTIGTMPPPRAPDDQEHHVGRHRAERRADHEQGDGGEHHGTPTVNVGQFAVERRHHGRGQKIGDDHPGQVLKVAEIAPDGRQRACHDGLVHRRQEAAQHQAIEDAVDLLAGQRRDCGLCLGTLLEGTHCVSPQGLSVLRE
jgi:hypothetical protein